MPHPVAVAAASTPPQPYACPPTPPLHLQPSTNPLLSQGQAFATHNFQSQVRSVLQHASTSCLRRALSQRARAHLQKLSQEQLKGDSSIVDLMGLDPDVLRVSEEDIQKCYGFAERVGNKWADVLKRQGYHEFANIAVDVVKRGRFLELEPLGASSTTTTAAEDAPRNDNDEQKESNCASAYTALHALRRYPPDCDGSGLPSKYLPVQEDDCNDSGSQHYNITSNSNNGQQSSAQKLIQQIDQMAHNGQSNWHHGWDAIEEAVKRNDTRMEYSRARVSLENYDIVPKQEYESMLLLSKRTDSGGRGGEEEKKDDDDDDDEGVGGGKSKSQLSKKHGRSPAKRKTVHFKDDDEDMVKDKADVDFLLSTNKKAILTLKKRRRRQEIADDTKTSRDDVEHDCEVVETSCSDQSDHHGETNFRKRGRPATSMGDQTLSWDDDVLKSMSMEERQKLIVSAIHPPYPFESAMKDETIGADDDEATEPAHNAVVCGALKEIGSTHLWEQTRHLPRTDNDGSSDDGEEEGTERNLSEGGNEIIYGASEARATFQSQQQKLLQTRALNRATRQRLGSRMELLKEVDAEYTKRAKCTKVKWTEDDPAQFGRLPDRHSEQSDGQPRKWVEMDLGECMVELADDSEETKSPGEGREGKGKRFVAFRSLEVALLH